MITPIGGTLIKRRYEHVFGHSPQTITTGVVKMLYPRDMEHIGYNIQCDHNAHTSNASNKKRYQIIKSMHVRVKPLDKPG